MVNRGELQKPKKAAAEDKKATVTLWLRDHYIQYLNRMCQILNYPEAGLQVPALKILMDLVKVESAFLGVQSGGHHFANDLYHRIVEALLNCSNMSQPLLSEFTEKYFGFYDDLRFYFLKDAAVVIDVALGTTGKNDKKAQAKKQKMGNRASPEKLSLMLENAFAIMETLKSMPTDDKELDEWWTGNPDPSMLFAQCLLRDLQCISNCDSEKGILIKCLFMHPRRREETIHWRQLWILRRRRGRDSGGLDQGQLC